MTKYSSAANTEKCVRAYHYYKLLSFRWHRIFTLTVARNEQFLVTLSAQVHRTADLKLGDREREIGSTTGGKGERVTVQTEVHVPATIKTDSKQLLVETETSSFDN